LVGRIASSSNGDSCVTVSYVALPAGSEGAPDSPSVGTAAGATRADACSPVSDDHDTAAAAAAAGASPPRLCATHSPPSAAAAAAAAVTPTPQPPEQQQQQQGQQQSTPQGRLMELLERAATMYGRSPMRMSAQKVGGRGGEEDTAGLHLRGCGVGEVEEGWGS
jgi:pyruvate/2-oxoglutarate dehydrogenase complex dihydrolipoamide acyltransferase (E2) component